MAADRVFLKQEVCLLYLRYQLNMADANAPQQTWFFFIKDIPIYESHKMSRMIVPFVAVWVSTSAV